MYVVYTKIVESGTRSWATLFTTNPERWVPPRRVTYMPNASVWMVPGTVSPED